MQYLFVTYRNKEHSQGSSIDDDDREEIWSGTKAIFRLAEDGNFESLQVDDHNNAHWSPV